MNIPWSSFFKTLQNSVKKLFELESHNISNIPYISDEQHKKYFTVSCIKHIFNSFKSVSKKSGCSIAFTILNTLSKFIKTGKDRIERPFLCDVVYKIICKVCEASYVGQTRRRLTTRIREHMNDINKKSDTPSVISTHRLQEVHYFYWNDVHILDSESSWYKKIISEMIHIKT